EIASLQRQLGVTTIYVTHDQTEALTMGDRVAVLKGGVLQQLDTPKALYHRPVNAFVAGFGVGWNAFKRQRRLMAGPPPAPPAAPSSIQ
ncbi:hypothetical protein ACC674_38005, partial [Rhizobium ruizarguesonis]